MSTTVKPLHVGLCRLDTGADGNRVGPATVDVTASVLSISGTFMNADVTPGSAEAIESAQVFVQQWLGLAPIPRSDLLRSNPIIPIWDSGRLGIDGFWRPLETGISMLEGAVSTSQGAVGFSGRFERIAGGNLAPIIETTIMRGTRVAARSADVAVYDCAVDGQEVAKPNGMQLDGSAAALNFIGLDGEPGLVSVLDLLVPDLLSGQDIEGGVVVNPTFTTSHRVTPAQFLNARPIIEYETGGVGSGRWHTLADRQFPPELIPDRLRLSNGVIRVTLASDPAGHVLIEVYDAPTTGPDTEVRWREARRLRLHVYDSGGDGVPEFVRDVDLDAPNMVPRVTRNTDGGVGIRLVLNAANFSSRALDVEVGRYLPLVTMRYADDDADGSRTSLRLIDWDDQSPTVVDDNSMRSSTRSDDHVFLHYLQSRILQDNAAAAAAVLPGSGGAFMSIPDAAAFDITGDICIGAWAALDDWTPAALNSLVSKWEGDFNQKSYGLGINTSGRPVFYYSTDGATTQSVTATAAVGVADGEYERVYVTVDVDNGAGGADVKFWTGGNGDTPVWTQLGTTVTVGSTISLFVSTQEIQLGAFGLSSLLDGKLREVAIYDGIGANTAPALGTTALIVDDEDFADARTAGGTTFTVDGGHVVTVWGSITWQVLGWESVGFSPLGRFALSASCGDSDTTIPTQALDTTEARFDMFNAAAVYEVEVTE